MMTMVVVVVVVMMMMVVVVVMMHVCVRVLAGRAARGIQNCCCIHFCELGWSID